MDAPTRVTTTSLAVPAGMVGIRYRVRDRDGHLSNTGRDRYATRTQHHPLTHSAARRVAAPTLPDQPLTGPAPPRTGGELTGQQRPVRAHRARHLGHRPTRNARPAEPPGHHRLADPAALHEQPRRGQLIGQHHLSTTEPGRRPHPGQLGGAGDDRWNATAAMALLRPHLGGPCGRPVTTITPGTIAARANPPGQRVRTRSGIVRPRWCARSGRCRR